MKIVLLTLSGDPTDAFEKLSGRFPEGAIEVVPREEFEQWRGLSRVRQLRLRRPEIFAVATERLRWQRAQNVFFLLGALAGARQSIIFDAHDGWREESGPHALLNAPARIAREIATSVAALKRADKGLRRLEAAVARHETLTSRNSPQTDLNFVYLRSSPGPGTQAGGAASHINGFLNAALALGSRVSLISNDEIAGLDLTKIPTKIIWPEPVGSTRAAFDIYNNLDFSKQAVDEIERVSPDFIYQRYARFSWAGVEASLRTNRPLLLEYNGSEVWVGRHWDRVGKLALLARYERLNLQAAARIFVVSEVERQNLLRAGVAETKIIVNPNGADTDRFKPGSGGAAVRRELDIAPQQLLVGFVGTFGPWHGVEVLAQAITLMPSEAPIQFVLIGTGALRSKVEKILRDGHAEHRAIFTGVVPHDRVPALLDACDVLVSPHVPLDAGAEFFGSPTKLFEYMSMGRPIVASRLGQIGEVLSHEETAILTEPGDAQELRNAIVRLYESRELRDRLGAAARRAATERHTWKQNAKRVLDAYRELTKS